MNAKKQNDVLLNELVGEMKNWLIHNESSLAHEMNKLRLNLNSVEKIIFKPTMTPDELESQMKRLHSIGCSIEHFGYQLRQLQDEISTYIRTANIATKQRNHESELLRPASAMCEPVPVNMESIESAAIAEALEDGRHEKLLD